MKKSKKYNFSWIILLVLFILGAVYLLDKDDNPSSAQDFKLDKEVSYNEPLIEIDPYNHTSFLHWDHMPLTYQIIEGCPTWQTELIHSGFDAIQNETNNWVKFIETNANPDISIYCNKSRTDDVGDKIAYAQILELRDKKIIEKGGINIFSGQKCGTGYPALEVHETLHLFDIGHNPLTRSIMNPFAAESTDKCNIKSIDEEYLSCLKFIYSKGVVAGSCNFSSYIEEEDSKYTCKDGYFLTKDKSGCCSRPNMVAKDGYCVDE